MIFPRSIQSAGQVLVLLSVAWAFGSLSAQGPEDSAAVHLDSLTAADSALRAVSVPEPDSMMRTLRDSAPLSAEKIIYAGESITFYPGKNVIVIQGQASVESGRQKLAADSLIAYNRNTGEVFVSGKPELTDGPEKITGSTLRYNIERDRGIIEEGNTTFGDWILKSGSLSKVGADSVFGRENRFTTCDRDSAPHFYFESPKVKVIRDKRVFASPVVLRVGQVPVFVLPFVFFPIAKGNRNSGILQPRIGVNSVMRERTTGRTIGNLGYFWALNDYVDFLGAVDIRTGSQTTMRGRTRYRKRYSYEGDLDARLIKDKINNSTGYTIFGRHNQTIGERSRLIGEVNYSSTRNLLRNTSFDQQDLLRQSLRSTASYSWRPSWGFFNSSVRHEMFLTKGDTRTVISLPSLSLSLNKRNLFPYRSRTVPSSRGVISTGWLYNITYGFSTDYSNTRTTTENDPARMVHRSTNRFDLDSPQTLYGWLKLNPGLRYSTELVHDNLSTDEKFKREQFLNFSTSMSTQVFGLFDGLKLGPIFRWRHTIRPLLTYNYQPDLSQDKRGNKVNRLSFSISNDVDYKYYQRTSQDKPQARKSDSGDREPPSKNGKLFSLRNSVDYDFIRAAKRDTLGWSNLNTSLTSTPASFINIQLLMNHELTERGPVEHFKPFMNRLSTTVTLRGTYKAAGEGPSAGELDEEAYFESQRYPSTIGSAFNQGMRSYDDQRDLAFSRSMPWSINLSHNLSRIRGGDKATQSLRWSLTFNPTPEWHLIYSSSYNFSGRGLQGQTFMLNRDLHCWQANLSFVTLPGGRFEFVFSTYLRANQAIRVPDVRRASN
ncbi:MAG TPA: putative LPS assembly protein LptD [archaeon]|nr:putative LPS assembly protein LptD [archaeon]